jgi:hypothetical protein
MVDLKTATSIINLSTTTRLTNLKIVTTTVVNLQKATRIIHLKTANVASTVETARRIPTATRMMKK